MKGAAWNRNFQPWKVVMVWCAGSSCVSLWDGRCAIRNKKKEVKNRKVEYTGSSANINMEWSRVQNMWGKWSKESFRFSPAERFVPTNPPLSVHYHCLLHSDATLLLSHLSPLAPEEENEKTIWAVFFTKSAVVGWAIKYTQMNSGSDVFQTLNVSGAGARWSKW